MARPPRAATAIPPAEIEATGAIGSPLGPSLLADQLDEPAGHDRTLDRAAVLLADHGQFLGVLVAEGGDEDPPLGKLVEEGRRGSRAPRR